MKIYNKTVRGYNHIDRNVPCEDFSGKFSKKEAGKEYCIAVVADGHGDESCFRSETGSEKAVEATISCLYDYANNFTKEEIPNEVELRRLSDCILMEWYKSIEFDDDMSPITEEEAELLKKHYNCDCKIGSKLRDCGLKNFAHVYGTTLIIALWLPNCLVLFQKGDGRCSVMFDDGSIKQLELDKRCVGNVTTSMCDKDASYTFKNIVIDFQKEKPIACMLSTDGVEDAFRDSENDLDGEHTIMGGVKTCFKYLLLEALRKTQIGSYEKYIEDTANKLTSTGLFGSFGSGDDVSIALIIDELSFDGPMLDSFKKSIETYELEEELFKYRDELNSKTRKYEILKKRRDGIVNAVEEEKERINQEIHQITVDIAKYTISKKFSLKNSLNNKKRNLRYKLKGLDKKLDDDSNLNNFKYYEAKYTEIQNKITEIKQKLEKNKDV